jgi:ERCC4-type nuclease
VEDLKKASEEELAAVVGSKLAKDIKQFLNDVH